MMLLLNVTSNTGALLQNSSQLLSIHRSSSLGLVLCSTVLGEVMETVGASVILSAVQGTALASNLCSSSPHSDTSQASALSTECLRLDGMVGS